MRHSHRSFVALVAALLVVAGCAGGGGTTATSGVQPSSVPAVSAPASSAPAASTAIASQPAAGGGGGNLPSDPCQLVTADDVTAIYGGSVSALGLNDSHACAFEIEGKAIAATSAATGEFAVSFGDEFTPYETAKVVFGDSVVKVDGLGTEAFSWGGFTHAKVGTGELVVGGVFVGNYDRAMLDQETFAMTKLLLSRI
jgi:hypothetical protein